MLSAPAAAQQILPIRIVIADDHPFFVDGFYAAMRKHNEVRVMGHAHNGKDLLDLVQKTQPDVVITDIQMPVMDGIAATREIKRRYPQIHVIAISAFAEDVFITEMLDAGASGYLLKNAHKDEIICAIERVVRNEMHYSLEVSNKVVALMKRTKTNPMKPLDKPRFTDKELAVMKEICKGYSSKEIAQVLQLEVRAVESARQRIMEKTGCSNSTAVAMYAVRHFIVQP